MSVTFFLDESGDLGWTLDLPFGAGGSSQHLTIATISSDIESLKHIGRFIKKLKIEFGFKAKDEMKWFDLNEDQRLIFAQKANKLLNTHDGLKCYAIILAKRGVNPNVRNEKQFLYNYLIKESLISKIVTYPKVTLIPDPQGIAPNSGSPLHQYIQHAAFEHAILNGETTTNVGFKQSDSKAETGIQFADLLSGVIQQHYEGINSNYLEELKQHIEIKELYFHKQLMQVVNNS